MKQFFAELQSSYELFLNKTCQEIKNKKEQNQLLSFCFALPAEFALDDFSHLFKKSPEVFYFSAKNEEFLAVGHIYSLSAGGRLRWKGLEKQYSNFPKPVLNSDEPRFAHLPLFLVSVKFDAEKQSPEWSDFKNSEFYVPKFLINFEIDTPLFRFNILVDNTFSVAKAVSDFSVILKTLFLENIDPQIEKVFENNSSMSLMGDKILWIRKVENALKEIRSGSLSKVVLARRIVLQTKIPKEIEFLPGRLKKVNPNSNVFFLKKSDSIFLGASPEKLIEMKDDNIKTEAIAGSRKRGATPEEDILLENELRNSEKEINEHRSVLDFITERLNPFTSNVQYSAVPSVKKMASIQHLSTEISAELKTGASIFSIVENIFPTPAVCGNPKEKAMQLISELEDFDRGLYAGLIGWISPTTTKFVVSIRSALINKNTIFAYAGCGIVEGSDPESEFTETETKFKTILSTLNEKN